MDPRLRFQACLVIAVLMVVLAPQTSDIATIRLRESRGVAGFEYPVLARSLYLAERSIASSRRGIALVNSGISLLAVLGIGSVLRRAGADVGLWIGAPTLVLMAVNVDALSALLALLAVKSWGEHKTAAAGLWAGTGAAFKIAPGLVLVPLMAASGWRRRGVMAVAAVGAWLGANLPLALGRPEEWRFPYEFASGRADGRGTIWAALGLAPGTTNLAAALLTLGVAAAVFAVVRRGRLGPSAGSALILLAYLACNKIWQPHYLLVALPLLAMARAPHRPVRALEIANLVCFAVAWRQMDPSLEPYWLWPACAARLAALAWLAMALLRDGRHRPARSTPAVVDHSARPFDLSGISSTLR